MQHADCGLLTPHFDQGNVWPIELATVCQIFLSQLQFKPTNLHLDSQSFDKFLISAGTHCQLVFALCTLKTRVCRQQNARLRLGVQPELEVAVACQPLSRGGDRMMNTNVKHDTWTAMALCRHYLSAHFEEQQVQVLAADGASR